MFDYHRMSDDELVGMLRSMAARRSDYQLMLLEELIHRFEKKGSEPSKIIEVESEFDEHDDAMEPLGSHNWEPPAFVKRGPK